MKPLQSILVSAVCVALWSAAQGRALPGAERPIPSVNAYQTKAAMTLEQAVAMVQAKYGAQVMRANTVQEGGRTVHFIRLMSADRSRVWTVRVDAATGQEF
jgi:uncharacterized membrane protein YkoI